MQTDTHETHIDTHSSDTGKNTDMNTANLSSVISLMFNYIAM